LRYVTGIRYQHRNTTSITPPHTKHTVGTSTHDGVEGVEVLM
jgi:hypothetical protein